MSLPLPLLFDSVRVDRVHVFPFHELVFADLSDMTCRYEVHAHHVGDLIALFGDCQIFRGKVFLTSLLWCAIITHGGAGSFRHVYVVGLDTYSIPHELKCVNPLFLCTSRHGSRLRW